MRISDWSSDVCSSDLLGTKTSPAHADSPESAAVVAASASSIGPLPRSIRASIAARSSAEGSSACIIPSTNSRNPVSVGIRSEEHTSELQSLMRISYAVFCLKKKKKNHPTNIYYTYQ